MENSVFFSLSLVLILGAAAQWLGWRFKIPSILLLLVAGFAVGPMTGVFNPDAMLGDLLFPVVSAAVAVILFEGGLTLRFSELKGIATTVFRLVFVGVLVTWVLAGYLAYELLGFDFKLAALFGALLSVTGPTVIGPMLRAIRPKGKVNNIAKWEGILIDPVGVLLAVFVFEIYIQGEVDSASSAMFWGLGKTLLIGGGFGGAAAGLLMLVVRMRWMPEFLHNLFILALVIGSFGLSNILLEESGLVTVTLMGVILANQRVFKVTHILHFKENLRVILISSLFIVLAARVDADTLRQLDRYDFMFLGALILFVRPIAVLFSTLFSKTTWNERILLMLLAPRGIVAVALSSVFALKLIEHNVAQVDKMLAVTLLVVVGTVLFYGIFARMVALRLGLSNLNPQGVLFVGAQSWARELAKALRDAGAEVIFVDTNRHHVGRARTEGFDAYCGNILSDEFIEEMDFSEIGHAVTVTQNNEVNSFAEMTLVEYIERSYIHPLPHEEGVGNNTERKALDPLFTTTAPYSFFTKQLANGAKFKVRKLEGPLDTVSLEEEFGLKILPLFGVKKDGLVRVFTEKVTPTLEAEDRLVFLELSDKDLTL